MRSVKFPGRRPRESAKDLDVLFRVVAYPSGMAEWIEKLSELKRRGTPCAMVVVTRDCCKKMKRTRRRTDVVVVLMLDMVGYE